MSALTRKIIQAVEHETKELEFYDLFNGHLLDLYEETAKLFQVSFRKGVPCIQLGKYLGLIPINDRLAIEVSARVPIENLERIVALADGYEPLVLPQHQRLYAKAPDRPASLLDSITGQFLGAVERIAHEGLWLEYQAKRHVGSFPAGRIAPFESHWRSRKKGMPVGVSTAFIRSPATEANNWILAALRKLDFNLRTDAEGSPKMRARLAACRRIFEPCAQPGFGRYSFRDLEMTIESIPSTHFLYLNALRLALLILSDMGIAFREQTGKTTLDSIFVDMEKIFEIYAREVLRKRLSSNADIHVLDGNKGGTMGAKKGLFSVVPDGANNPDVTPDIVIRKGDSCALILDAKYKALKGMPDRQDLNQIATYAASYNCSRGALLYAQRAPGQAHMTKLGDMNGFELFVSRFDLSAINIQNEEADFADAIVKVLHEGH